MKFLLALLLVVPARADLAALQAAYVAQGCGALIGWNMSTMIDNANSGGQGYAPPNIDQNTFAPTVSGAQLATNIDTWIQVVAAAGCKYAVLTTMHHDGFKLWNSTSHVGSNPVYGAQSTTWYSGNGSPDITLLFVNACRAHGINPVIYYSIWDRTMEAQNSNCATPSSAPCLADYVTKMELELNELLSNYGAITAIWTDKWEYGLDAMSYNTIYAYVKGIQPSCLFIANSAHTSRSDIVIWEIPAGDPIPSNNTLPSEGADSTILASRGYQWFWNSGSTYFFTDMQTTSYILTTRQYYNARNAAYDLSLGPDRGGVIPANEITIYQGLYEAPGGASSGGSFAAGGKFAH